MKSLPIFSNALHLMIFCLPYIFTVSARDYHFSKLNYSETNLTIPSPVHSPTTSALLQSKKSNVSSNQEFEPNQQPASTTEESKKKKKTTLSIALGSGIGFLVIILCIVCWVVLLRLRKTKYSNEPCYELEKSNRSTQAESSLSQQLCRRFSLSEIVKATKGFHQDLVIGIGGFGDVYKGFIDEDEGSTIVAVKRCKPGSNQGAKQFVKEIEIMSKFRYVHLVSLIGYCAENGEMILVYEYVANGTLRDHLYGSNNDPLSWKQRLEICVGAARGLHYLHSGVKYSIVHRDVKTTNILLDENWVAKVSDSGLSNFVTGDKLASTTTVMGTLGYLDPDYPWTQKLTCDVGTGDTTVSTIVKGTFGYLDPKYAQRQKLTNQSDVYSFGVVLLEVLCARKPLNITLDEAQCYLAYWARKCMREGTIQNIIDPFLMGKIAPECFKKFVGLAESWLRDSRIQRPTMGDVIEKLESALELQEQADAEMNDMNPDGIYSYPELSFRESDIHVPVFEGSDSDT